MRIRQIADPQVKTKHGMLRALPHGKFKEALDELDVVMQFRPADASRVGPSLAKVTKTGEAFVAAQQELTNLAPKDW